MNSFNIQRLKNRARNSAIMYEGLLNDRSCGHLMLQHTSAEATRFAREFDDAMEKLSKIDPDFPKNWTRLYISERTKDLVG